MQKIFYISGKAENSGHGVAAPELDRFQRVEQLNNMLSLGWHIKEFINSADNSYFVLEKQ